MKHIAQIRQEFSIHIASLEKDVKKAIKADNKVVIFLGGDCSDDNKWRKSVKEKFADKEFVLFLDPYDEKWEAEDNIYDEVAALFTSSYAVFYKGGELSEKEQSVLDAFGKPYKSFDDLSELKKYVAQLIKIADEFNNLLQMERGSK